MYKKLMLIMAVALCSFHISVKAQSNRLKTHNTIGWYNYFGNIKVSKKLGIHTEYQWRRTNLITNWQQSLLRIGINYQANPNVLLRAGYGWIETFPYGEYAINGMGKDFTEHRIFEMVQLSHKQDWVDLSHRFMLEQRFVGRYSSATDTKETSYPLLHRGRYMVRLQAPFKQSLIGTYKPYAALYNEVFIGFGKNVNANIFDQNRFGILLGSKLNETLRLEAGYLNQTVQFGRLIGGKNVFQYNNGLVLNLHAQINALGKN